jgi:hypothetical protein
MIIFKKNKEPVLKEKYNNLMKVIEAESQR